MILEIKTEDSYEDVVKTLSRELCPSDFGCEDACRNGCDEPTLCIDCWKGALKEVAELGGKA